MSSPLRALFIAMQHAMSGSTDTSIFIGNTKREKLLTDLVVSYYSDRSSPVVFDTNRGWCQSLPVIANLFPGARVICCVRNPAWILDSVERHIQKNQLVPSILFNYEAGYTTYSRVEMLTKPDGLVGYPLAAFRQAWFGECADRLIVLPYETLTERPAYAMERLYELLSLTPFEHDFESVEHDEPQFDSMLALPGFHKVKSRVEANVRDPIIPPDLFQVYDSNFWNDPDQNPRAVSVI